MLHHLPIRTGTHRMSSCPKSLFYSRKSNYLKIVFATIFQSVFPKATCTFARNMSTNIVSCIDPLGFPFKTADPFLFCVYHNDNYPAGDEKMQAPRKIFAFLFIKRRVNDPSQCYQAEETALISIRKPLIGCIMVKESPDFPNTPTEDLRWTEYAY